MIRLLIACYPSAWRRRFGDEFAAVLEARPLGPFDVVDVLLGAADARLHPVRSVAGPGAREGVLMSQRIGGLAAIAGGLVWFFVLVASVLRLTGDSAYSGIVLLLGTLLQLVALTGLSAFQAHRHPRLVWAAFALPAAGGVVSLAGLAMQVAVGDTPVLLGLSPWSVWMAGLIAMVAGSSLFAIATLRAGTLSRPGAAVLLVGSLLTVPAMLGLSGGIQLPGEALLLMAVAAFSTGWVALGTSALRMGSRQVAAGYAP